MAHFWHAGRSLELTLRKSGVGVRGTLGRVPGLERNKLGDADKNSFEDILREFALLWATLGSFSWRMLSARRMLSSRQIISPQRILLHGRSFFTAVIPSLKTV